MARLNPTPDFAPMPYMTHRRILRRVENDTRNVALTAAIDTCLDIVQLNGTATDCVLALNMLKDKLNSELSDK